MLLYEPEPTQADLRFRLFGVEVRVHPFFWLVSLILGWDHMANPEMPGSGATELALWVLASFVSILLHEFGHIWMGQAFGSHGYIVLQGMGGLAVGAGQVNTRWQRVLVTAAGPGIQLALLGVIVALLGAGVLPYPRLASPTVWTFLKWVTTPQFQEVSTPLSVFVGMMLFINLFWPLLNLLPIYPLDGGQITREACEAASPRTGLLASLWVSVILAAVIAANAFVADPRRGRPGFLPDFAPTGWYVGLLFASLAFAAWQVLQIEQSRRSSYDESDERMPWER